MEMKYFVWKKKIETDISYFKCRLFERRHVESPNSPRYVTTISVLSPVDHCGQNAIV